MSFRMSWKVRVVEPPKRPSQTREKTLCEVLTAGLQQPTVYERIQPSRDLMRIRSVKEDREVLPNTDREHADEQFQMADSEVVRDRQSQTRGRPLHEVRTAALEPTTRQSIDKLIQPTRDLMRNRSIEEDHELLLNQNREHADEQFQMAHPEVVRDRPSQTQETPLHEVRSAGLQPPTSQSMDELIEQYQYLMRDQVKVEERGLFHNVTVSNPSGEQAYQQFKMTHPEVVREYHLREEERLRRDAVKRAETARMQAAAREQKLQDAARENEEYEAYKAMVEENPESFIAMVNEWLQREKQPFINGQTQHTTMSKGERFMERYYKERMSAG